MDRAQQEQAWEAVLARDASFDGRLFFGVLTTGVYCRPSCPARRALRRNVRFYSSAAEAEADGLRPCRRCRPAGADPRGKPVRAACRYIEEHGEERISVEALARQAGISERQFQRLFQAEVGVSPKEYAEAVRVRRLKRNLRAGPDVTDAIYATGFGSPSRVYERAAARLGMTPREYREGGRGAAITYVAAETALGTLMLGATDRGLCFVQFGASEDSLAAELRREYPDAQISPAGVPLHPELEWWMQALREHLEGRRRDLDLPLDIRATAFQMQVWRYLQTIPYGRTASYGEVASGIGKPAAVRAVASACAANRTALVIPCHRVIRGSGGEGGYRWGADRKRALLQRERMYDGESPCVPSPSF